MDQNVKEFIENYINLIEEHRFKELYILAELKLGMVYTYDITTIFYKAGINPLKYLEYIPSNFMAGVHENYPVDLDLSDLMHIKQIESEAFAYSPLQNIILPESLEIINDSAFLSSGLRRIIIPKSVSVIGDAAFFDCKSLCEIVIEGSPYIGNNTFGGNHLPRIIRCNKDTAKQLPSSNIADHIEII